MTQTDSKKDREEKSVTRIYAGLAASLLLTFVPNAACAAIALVLFCGVLIAAYVQRNKSEEHSLSENHMTYIIRTMWIGSFFAAVLLGVGSAYMISVMDISSMMSCADNMMDAGASPMPWAEMEAIVQPCIDLFIRDNFRVILTVGIFCGGPVIIYFLYRLAYGLNRASKGHRIGNVKNWF